MLRKFMILLSGPIAHWIAAPYANNICDAKISATIVIFAAVT